MAGEEQSQQQEDEGFTSDEIIALAKAMKDNAPSSDEKHNVHTFLNKVVEEKDSTKIANLRVDEKIDELGKPEHTVRGCKEMQLISDKIMNNDYFAEYFEKESENTLASSLSREGFLIRQATTQTKAISDVTKRKKFNKGMFGSKKIVEESGGDPYLKD